MALDLSLKMAIVDISLIHLLKKNNQSPKRTAKKIIELCKNVYPDMNPISEKSKNYMNLLDFIEHNDFLSIRQWIMNSNQYTAIEEIKS